MSEMDLKMKYFRNRVLKKSPNTLKPALLLAGSACIIFLLYLLYFKVFLHFNMFRSDVLQYWKMSYHLNTPFNVWWAPGYPLLIAFTRTLTLNFFPPLVIMTGISLIGFLIAVQTVYKEAVENKCSNPAFFSLIFIFFPFVGLNYTIFPMADIISISLFFCAIHNLKNSRLKHFMVYSALALLFHKVMWFFIPPLTVWGLITLKRPYFYFILPYVPLLLWIVSGACYHNDFFWFLRSSFHLLVSSNRTTALFDSITTPLLSASIVQVTKGLILLSITIFTVFSLYVSIQRKLWISAAICFSLLVITAIINNFEAWVIARYSKLLIIPIVSFSAHIPQTKGVRILQCAIILLFLFSNLIFGFYMARIFYT
jgi:hypothetical protein